MDPTRFDSLTKVLSGSETRRWLLGGSLSAALVGMTGALRGERAGAKSCKEVSKRCHKNGHCCSGFCEPNTRQCVSSCEEGEGNCSARASCAPGCSCYQRAFGEEMVCLRDPANPPACAGLQVCLDSDDECPRGHLCTASTCCGADAVCLPLCEATSG
jgi:hypothetical protein